MFTLAQEVQKKYLNFRGHHVYYETRGNSVKTLVFIHGWTSSIQSWKYQLDSFRDYKVIAVDLPGHGKSSKNPKAIYTMELFADTVKTILEREGITGAYFFGHSMGFAVVEVMLVKYPEKCQGVGSIDGARFELPDKKEEREKWIKSNRQFAKLLDTEGGREAFINMLFLSDTPQILKDEIFKVSRQVPLSIGKKMVQAVEKDMKFWKRKVIQKPCLALYTSAYQLPKDYPEKFKISYPQVEYHEIKGVSHFLMLEIPYKVNQLIRDFLSKNYRL
jgi:pimeloyl-ACP methyl ester carboxylesterase